MHRVLVVLVAVLLWLPAGAAADATSPQIAIIIDDLGHRLDAGRRTIGLPGPVVCAVLPHTPHARRLASEAHWQGKEILLHQPLQATAGEASPEPGALLLDMGQRKFAQTLHENLELVPHVIGINGHRGSLLTRHPGAMEWLMAEIAARELIFVDSYTTHHSVALDLAREHGIPATRRHVFLDNDRWPDAIAREFERLLKRAHRDGYAVAIGHPYPATLEFLEEALPGLESRGVRLVGIRALLGAGPAHYTAERKGERPQGASNGAAVEPRHNESF